MEEADQLCNRVAIMDHGRILALDTPRALKQSIDADTIVTTRATGSPEQFASLLERELEGVARTRVVDGSVQADVQNASELLPKIIHIAERAGLEVQELSIAEPTLETVFINLTGKDLRD
jgi:ABC-2 type transport system ATP-binding protein